MSMRAYSVAVIGALLIAVAVFIPGRGIETALGRTAGELSWGPALFRIMLALHGAVLIGVGLRRRSSERAEAPRPLLNFDSVPVIAALGCMMIAGLVLRVWKLDT